MNKKFLIKDKEVGEKKPAFIIAELSCNHLQNYDLAVKSVHAMKECGVDAVKLQTVQPGAITIDSDKDYFKIKGGTLWDDRTLFDLYKEAYTPWEWHQPLKELIESLGMVFFSSPFDHQAVDFLSEMDVPAYKIASFEITDIPLIKHVASKGKPVIISTGIATHEDISDAIEACYSQGNYNVVILKCTSSYPTPWDEVNLNVITEIQKKHNVLVGLSDHTLGDIVALGAVSLGACVIEKHFILDRNMGGPDAPFSMEPAEFKLLVDRVRILEKTLGSNELVLSEKTKQSRMYARSLFVVSNVKKGEIFTTENVKSIRPGHGMKPKFLEDILGKKAICDIERGTPLSNELIE